MATPAGDPFPNTSDPAAYVPRTATEAVLVRLEMELRHGARVVCLGGPSGSGKTLLLRVLEERLDGDFEPVRVPYPKLDPDEFCHWALAVLNASRAQRAEGERRPSDVPRAGDPEQALAARIAFGAAAGRPPLVWMVDDAECLPIPTLRCLLRLQGSARDALRILLVGSDAFPLHELTRASVPIVHVELEGGMDGAEMAHYVRARLDRAGTGPEPRARLETALDRLYARSGGNPGRLHAAAAALLCFGPEKTCAVNAEESPAEPSPPVEIVAAVAPEMTAAAASPPESDPPQHGEESPAPAKKRRRLRRLGRR